MSAELPNSGIQRSASAPESGSSSSRLSLVGEGDADYEYISGLAWTYTELLIGSLCLIALLLFGVYAALPLALGYCFLRHFK